MIVSPLSVLSSYKVRRRIWHMEEVMTWDITPVIKPGESISIR
jgi:hypothetical protein